MIKKAIFLFFLVLASCRSTSKQDPDERLRLQARGNYLEITYTLAEAEPGEVPSYQTAVWLADAEGRFFKTLFVSVYLAFGGARYPEICPDWTQHADWSSVSREEFDAITGPTPFPGRTTLLVDCGKRNVPPGVYTVFIQTHGEGEKNTLSRGTITVGTEPVESSAVEVTEEGRVQAKPPLLDSITINYYPQKHADYN